MGIEDDVDALSNRVEKIEQALARLGSFSDVNGLLAAEARAESAERNLDLYQKSLSKNNQLLFKIMRELGLRIGVVEEKRLLGAIRKLKRRP